MFLPNLAAALGSRIILLDLKDIPADAINLKAVRYSIRINDPSPDLPVHEYHLRLALIVMGENIERERRAEIDLDHKMMHIIGGKLIERSAPVATYDEDGLFAYWTIICVYRYYRSEADLSAPKPKPEPEPLLPIFNSLRRRAQYWDEDLDDMYYDYDDDDGWEWTPEDDAIQSGPFSPSYATGIRADQLI